MVIRKMFLPFRDKLGKFILKALENGAFGHISSIIGKKYLVIEWLPWLPNNSDFINYNILETLKDSPSTPPSSSKSSSQGP